MHEFSNYGLAHDPQIEISKQMDEFSSNTVWLMIRKTMSYSSQMQWLIS